MRWWPFSARWSHVGHAGHARVLAGLDQAGERGQRGPGGGQLPQRQRAGPPARHPGHPEADGHRGLAAGAQPHRAGAHRGAAKALEGQLAGVTRRAPQQQKQLVTVV